MDQPKKKKKAVAVVASAVPSGEEERVGKHGAVHGHEDARAVHYCDLVMKSTLLLMRAAKCHGGWGSMNLIGWGDA